MMRYILILAIAFTSLCDVRADDPDFARDVRPILSRFCFKCHGPDEKARKAKLRLDVRDEAIRSAITPNQPDKSELVARIHSDDDETRMPPPSTKLTMSKEQKDVLRRWIAGGAPYPTHWSFVAPKSPVIPNVSHPQFVIRNPIDAFILAKMQANGLQPSPEADRVTLIRRLSLDLIGLPPTLEEVQAFIDDRSSDAYEKLVDRLLASSNYGERWARRWLDLARYADTNGYEKDRVRSIWPYRDWVIRSINADMPFDQFSIEQLAGDMLPNATSEQRIATGFHRNTMLNEEGGIDPQEFRFYAMTDRIATTGTTWLGLTIGCAQCHTHKYDPIVHREYYQLMAFLNNADEPEIDIERTAILAQRNAIESQIDAKIAELPKSFPGSFDEAFAKWLKAERSQVERWTILRPTEAKSNLPILTVESDDAVFVSGDMSKADTYELRFAPKQQPIRSIRLEVLPDDRLPGQGPGRVFYEGPKGEFFLSEFTLLVNGKKVPIARVETSFPNAGAGSKMLDGDQQSGWSISGGQGKRHIAIFHLAEPLNVDRFDVKMLFERYYAAGLGRFRFSVSSDANPETHASDAEELLRKSAPERQLRNVFVLNAPELANDRQSIDQLRKSLPAFPTTLVMRERPDAHPRPTFLHHRGEFLQPKEAVSAGIPSFLPPLPNGVNPNRLMFAKWLFSRDNPLTARVTVNRQWAALFGRGIVRTTEDFGIQGDLPTHPELLDWLAIGFVNDQYSMKRLHRLIVMSSTYRQSSRMTPDGLTKDAENKWLVRGPRVRLEAEVIRDSVLRVSGLLSSKLGGPSVFPPQPANVTTEGTYGSLPWKASVGEDRYRRSLYTFSKRTAPFAMFNTFDAPSGEACIARRDVSNTPLQALTLLNDAMFTEAAQAIGRTFAVQQGSVEERMKSLFQQCLTRSPTRDELSALMAFYETQRGRFASGELDARKIAGEGIDRAAWTTVARVLFNLDEMITKN